MTSRDDVLAQAQRAEAYKARYAIRTSQGVVSRETPGAVTLMSAERTFVRDTDVVMVSVNGRVLFVRPEKETFEVAGGTATALVEAFAQLAEPVPELVVRELISADAFDQLVHNEMFIEVQMNGASASSGQGASTNARMVVCIDNTPDATEMVSVVRHLQLYLSKDIDVVLIDGDVVSSEALTHLGVRVWRSIFDVGSDLNNAHIQLAQDLASLVLVMPASAKTVHKIAHAACDDLVSLIVCATRAPVVVVPDLSRDELLSPEVREDLALLRADGMFVAETRLDIETGRGRTGIQSQLITQVLRFVLNGIREGWR